MLKIGEFSRLSQLTVKALRFYEKEGLLVPKSIDPESGYRYYETIQLTDAAKIKAYRQLDLSIEEIRSILTGEDVRLILARKAEALQFQKQSIDVRLSIIKSILEEDSMQYQVTVKEIPACTVYTNETTLPNVMDKMEWIPAVGAECQALNPDLKCAEPPYEFVEYLDGEYREVDVRIRHSEAVADVDEDFEIVRFHLKKLPATKVLSILHKGPYEQAGSAYAFITKYAEDNGYTVTGPARESYIDGIWNKESPEDWLTEIQLPIA